MLFALLIGAAAPAAEVYRWVDADGSVHYSDRPQEGAETITLPSAQTFKAPVVNRRRPPTATTGSQTPEAAQAYRKVEIVRPAQEEVVWNTGGQIDVAVTVEPKLQSGHKLQIYLDNQRVEGLEPGDTQITLKEVFRGQHSLRAEVRGTSGVKLIESLPVKFTVQQTSQLNPDNPNANPDNPNAGVP
jgi:hypothetical protein